MVLNPWNWGRSTAPIVLLPMESQSTVTNPPRSKRLRLSLKRKGSPVDASTAQKNSITFQGAERKSNVENVDLPMSNSSENGTKDLVKICGIRNVGNTCYLAVVVQLIRSLPSIPIRIRKLSELAAEQDIESAPSIDLLLALDALLVSMEEKEGSQRPPPASGCLPGAPDSLLAALKKANPLFGGGGQHDAQECLQCILDHLETACNLIASYREPEASSPDSTVAEKVAERATKASGARVPCQLNGGSGPASLEPGFLDGPGTVAAAAAVSDRAPKTQGSPSVGSSGTPACSGDPAEPEDRSAQPSPSSAAVPSLSEAACASHSSRSPCSAAATERGEKAAAESKRSLKPPARLVRRLSEGDISCMRSSKRLRTVSSGDDDNESASSSGQACKVRRTGSGSCAGVAHRSGSVSSVSACSSATDCSTTAAAAAGTTKPSNCIAACFQGVMVACTQCLECEGVQRRHENFSDLSVSVCKESTLREQQQQQQQQRQSSSRSILGAVGVVQHSLNWCIGQLMRPKSGLSGANKYSCGLCRRSTEARISYLFDTLPSLLLIQLKRFTTVAYGSSMSSVKKIHGNVATPIEMSLSSWCSASCSNQDKTYRLVAIIMHAGAHSSTGHYTVYCREPSSSSSSSTKSPASPAKSQPASSSTETQLSSPAKSTAPGVGPSSEWSPSMKTKSCSVCVHRMPIPCNLSPLKSSAGGSGVSVESSRCICPGRPDTPTSSPSSHPWLYIDDATVERVSEDDVVLALSPLDNACKQLLSPYILCYAVS